MLDVFNIAKPQNCDIQTFYGGGASPSSTKDVKTWSKPRGVSNVYFLLIGSGGSGDSTNGGGSGAVTVWYGAAQNVPDNLEILVGIPGNASQIRYRTTSTTSSTLLLANAGSTPGGGAATTANTFAASGFYQSIAGQTGSTGGVSASSTTFLSGGGGAGNTATANYGYSSTGNGFFQLQPIIVGVGCISAGVGGIGCGGGVPVTGIGGPGMVLIASW